MKQTYATQGFEVDLDQAWVKLDPSAVDAQGKPSPDALEFYNESIDTKFAIYFERIDASGRDLLDLATRMNDYVLTGIEEGAYQIGASLRSENAVTVMDRTSSRSMSSRRSKVRLRFASRCSWSPSSIRLSRSMRAWNPERRQVRCCERYGASYVPACSWPSLSPKLCPLRRIPMMRLGAAIAFSLALAACGQGAQNAGGAQSNAVCALISDADALFGADAEAVVAADVPGAAGGCSWNSANGQRGGDVLLYNAASLGSTAPDAQMTTFAESWDAMTETPLQAVDGLGEAAQIATDLPGYQTQIVFRRGENVVAVLARSGDEAMTGEALARAMAAQADASLQAN